MFADWLNKSPQEIFDHVAEHLFTQNKRAVDITPGATWCRYRAQNNLKCAVGCLIDDSEYTPDLEQRAVADLVREFGGITAPNIRADRINLLVALQGVHDTYDPIDWEYRLREAADYLDLSPAKIDEIKEKAK